MGDSLARTPIRRGAFLVAPTPPLGTRTPNPHAAKARRMFERLRKAITGDLPPDPANASPDDVAKYTQEYLRHNPHVAEGGGERSDPTVQMPYAKADSTDAKFKSEFPWLYDPSRGVRWDFDPVELRVLSQENAWVQMMVQSITKEISETSWTITDSEDARETQKRLNTHPDKRDPIQKDLPDATAEDIFERLRHPTPDLDWSDAVEMWLRDYLEIGSMAGVKSFDEQYYNADDELAVDAETIDPLLLQPTAPEVWTKDYRDKSGMLSGFWQFDRRSSPGGSSRGRGLAEPIHFSTDEVLWSDNAPATNRRYGDPPTLFVKEFLQSVDLAVTQEQQYLSRGSIPSGAWVFEEWDREEVKEWKEENAENIKGKPHKSLMFAGRGGDVRFEAMSMNFSELEFTERMKWYARVIASAFQVPTAVVGIEPERVNYNTFQGERENFESNTLGPYLQDFERWLNGGYVQKHWDGYRFEFTPGMSETTKQMRSERIRSEWNANLRTREDAARELGIDVPDDAEDGFKADVVDEVNPEDAGDALSGLVANEVSKDDAEPLRNTDEWAAFDVQPGEVEALREELADDIQALFDDVLTDEEIQREIERLAADETDKSLTAITRRIKDLLRSADLADSIQERLTERTTDAALEAVESASREAGATEDVDTQAIRAQLEARETAFADEFANSVADEIRETVGDGFAEGLNSDEIGREIADAADLESGWGGAERIARQELQIATGKARSATAEQLGKIEVWMTAGDDRVRDAHAAMDGLWKHPGESWTVEYDRGTKTEDVPGDSEPGIGCRCQVLLRERSEVDADDYAGSEGL